MKRSLCVILAAALVLGMGLWMPLPVLAQTLTPPQVEGTFSVPTQVNPLYADTLEPDALAPVPKPRNTTTSFDESLYVSENTAAQTVRQYLKDRTMEFTMYVRTADSDLTSVIIGVMDQAFAHTGVPDEGDYLNWQYSSWGASNITYYYIDNVYYLNIPYSVEYCTTADQEAQVDAAVEALLEELDLYDSTPYEKICGIYDYITANVTYDYENLNDNEHLLKYTAYAALLDGTAVCQGYSNLFYRLALELGVDNRIVVGETDEGVHSWNLVQLDDRYYYVDATWDAARVEAGYPYAYFLKGSDHFTDHVPFIDTFAAFLPDYPISTADYGDPDGGIEGGQDQPIDTDWSYDANEWEVLRETNRERYANGLTPLTTMDTLCQVAEVRARELTQYFSHTRPDGRDCFSVIDEMGLPYSMAAENIAAGQSTGDAAVEAWMNSDGHRANILNGSYVHMGAGYAILENDYYRDYWAQFFLSTWSCRYTGMELNLETVTVTQGTGLEEIQLWATMTCGGCGDCYLPILAEYCTGYDPEQVGTQTVTVSCLGLSDTLDITVEPKAITYGDASGDGTVNSRDVILLRQYIAGWDVEIDPAAANVNGDPNGDINGLDMILLRQYVAGWDVTLGG